MPPRLAQDLCSHLEIIVIEALVCVFLIGFVATLARLSERSWIAPAAFFALLWAGYATAAAFFVVDLHIYARALLWIAVACGSIQLGAMASHRSAHGLPGR